MRMCLYAYLSEAVLAEPLGEAVTHVVGGVQHRHGVLAVVAGHLHRVESAAVHGVSVACASSVIGYWVRLSERGRLGCRVD